MIIFIIITLILIFSFLQKLIKNSFSKGFKEGEKEVLRSLMDKSYWFNQDKKTSNILQLYCLMYTKYGYVSADNFRRIIEEMDHTKRITEIPEDKLKEII